MAVSVSGAGGAGQRLGRYHLSEPVGAGPIGEVFRAKVYGVAGFERQFAVKCIHAELAETDEGSAKLAQAARLYGLLEHPRIARMHEFGVASGTTFTATELVRGLHLTRVLEASMRSPRPLPPGAWSALLSATARAVGFAHGRGLTHLGLCPTNVVCTSEGDVKVTDFGMLATRLGNRPAADADLRARLPYLAPEQLRGENTSPATDVFQLGVLAFEMFSGRPLARGRTAEEIELQILDPSPVQLTLPKPLAKVIQRALARPPLERFPDAGAFADALDAAVRQTGLPGQRRDLAAVVRTAMESRPPAADLQLSGDIRLPGPGAAASKRSSAQAAAPLVPPPGGAAIGRLPSLKRNPAVPAPAGRPGAAPIASVRSPEAKPLRQTAPRLRSKPDSGGPDEAPTRIRGERANSELEPTNPNPQLGGSPPTLLGVSPRSNGRGSAGPPSALGRQEDSGELLSLHPSSESPEEEGVTVPSATRRRPNSDNEFDSQETMQRDGGIEQTDKAAVAPVPQSPPRPPAHNRTIMSATPPPSPAPKARPSRQNANQAHSTTLRGGPLSNVVTEPVPVEQEGSKPLVSDVDLLGKDTSDRSDDLNESGLRELGKTGVMESVTDVPHFEDPRERGLPEVAVRVSPGAPHAQNVPGAAPARRRRGPHPLLLFLLLAALSAGGYFGYAMYLDKTDQPPADKARRVVAPLGDAGTAVAQATDAATAVATGDGGAKDTGDAGALAQIADAGASASDAGLAGAGDQDGGVLVAEPTADGRLAVTSKPKGAKVYIDGTLVGRTPLDLDPTSDQHTLAVIQPGYKLYTTEIEGSGAVHIELVEATPPGGPAGIKVRCRHKNRYYVIVDGIEIGQLCPTERIGVELGDHQVEIYDPVTDQRRVYPVKVDQTRLSHRIRVD